MPVQQEMANFAKKLGGRIAEVNAEHADKPVDTGNRRLPSNIKDGVAKLSAMYTKEQTEDGAKTPKGQIFFRASAVVLGHMVGGKLVDNVNGERIEGLMTQVIIPICDVPERGKAKATSLSENWFKFQNLFKRLSHGAIVCRETKQTDPTSEKTWAFYLAAMKALTDPVRAKTNPVYVSFSTRGFKPDPTPAQPNPEEMTLETWHELAEYNGKVDPAAGVTVGAQPPPMTPPPTPQTSAQRAAAPPSVNGPATQYQPDGDADHTDVVAALVEAAMADPDGITEDGAAASSQLEDMAWSAGWTKEQTNKADNWAQVGDMALSPPKNAPTPTPNPNGVAVGSRWFFAKRDKSGNRLKNGKGEDFPSQEVEVTSFDATTSTCTVKTTKDHKDVVDIRSKKPVAVQFGWLEPTPY